MDRIEAWSRELFSFDVRPFLEERVFAPGEFILREGSFPQHLYFLTQGRAKIYTTHKNGKVSLLNFPAAPDLIGDMELLEVRLVLERFVVRDAAAHITPRQLDALEQLLDEMKQAIGQKDLGGYSRCNQQLHQVIYSACSNRSAAELLCSVKARISRFDLKTILLPGRDRQSLAEHAALCQALREGDPERAEALAAAHVEGIQEVLEQYSTLLL